MIAGQVIVKDGLTAPLDRFGEAAPKMLDQILRRVGYRYRAHIKKNYLSGQMLGSVSGTLVRSLVVGRRKGAKHVYLVGSKAVVEKQNFGGFVITRSTASAIKLANIYEHAGGYVIEPKTEGKKLVFGTPNGIVFTKRVQGRERPFMSASAQSFPWADAFDRTTDELVAKELKKAGLGGAS